MFGCRRRRVHPGMAKDRKIDKLLAAIRSEIAIRIFRAANELGLRTVAVYSNEDRLALHRFKADEAYLIGKGKGPVEAYLDITGIVAVAKSKGVDAIHPGYGFLSENAAFARACEKAGITFIGPTPELLEMLGDKTAARRLATSAGVPVLPGTEKAVKSADEAKKIAKEIGYPVIVKAAMGGGGRGMRVVHDESELEVRIEEAQGHNLHEEAMALPRQEKIPLYGAALQCRVTTEDPEKNFAPDYGKLTTYRSPAGFGIRLDGGTAYAGASLAPYYDSLLVKVTAWGTTLPEACQRMDRALREFRIRGVKTNIPFVENVVNHPKFRSGEVTTGFLEQHPELFRFPKRGDRATKLLSYLGDVILNGNPEVKGEKAPEVVEPATLPAVPGIEPQKGSRQLLKKLGPGKFAEWAKKEKRLLITDTTLRDAHQSLMATRVRTYDLLATATAISQRLPNLFSLEMWGGATFDTSLRFLHEDPWQRLRSLRERVPNICFQMLLRGANAVGYASYPDNVIREFVPESHP